jgi:hypothetical protein
MLIGLIIAFYTVYLFIGQHVALVHFVKALYRVKELQSGDYMVISIDDFILDAEGNNAHKYTSAPDPYLSAMKEDDAIQAFRSVLKVTESYPRNPDFKSVHIPNSFIFMTRPSCLKHFWNFERTTTQESDGQNDEVLVPATFLLG